LHTVRERKRARWRPITFLGIVAGAAAVGAFLLSLVIGLVATTSVVELVQQRWFITGWSVPFFTFLFDLVDLRPTVGSFSFIASKTYGTYLTFRTLLGFLAVAVLGAANLVPDPLLLSLVSVVTSITVLQNFALNVGGKSMANLSELFQTFKSMLEGEEARRVAQEKDAEMLELTAELASLPLQALKSDTLLLSLRNPSPQDPLTQISTLADETSQKIYLADYLVKQNVEYSRSIIGRERAPKPAT